MKNRNGLFLSISYLLLIKRSVKDATYLVSKILMREFPRARGPIASNHSSRSDQPKAGPGRKSQDSTKRNAFTCVQQTLQVESSQKTVILSEEAESSFHKSEFVSNDRHRF